MDSVTQQVLTDFSQRFVLESYAMVHYQGR